MAKAKTSEDVLANGGNKAQQEHNERSNRAMITAKIEIIKR